MLLLTVTAGCVHIAAFAHAPATTSTGGLHCQQALCHN
jgi:hypothetical protein